jgi:hypothetical protein
MSEQEQTFPEWQHKLVLDRPCHLKAYSYLKEARIKVTAGLHYIRGNSAPYWFVTANIYKPGARDSEAGGCLHDEVLKTWPSLAPVVALHLSDHDGQPMYAEGNGWYWLAGWYGGAGERYHGGSGSSGKAPEECLRIFAEHVRISVDEAKRLAEAWQVGVPYDEAKPHFVEWVKEQRGRWKAESDEARELLDQRIAEERGKAVVGTSV